MNTGCMNSGPAINGSHVRVACGSLNFDLPARHCHQLAREMTLADLVADSEDEEYLFRSKGSLSYLPLPVSTHRDLRTSPRPLSATGDYESTTI